MAVYRKEEVNGNLVKYVGIGLLVMGLAACDIKTLTLRRRVRSRKVTLPGIRQPA